MDKALGKAPAGLDALGLLYAERLYHIRLRGDAVVDHSESAQATLSLRLARQQKRRWQPLWMHTTDLSDAALHTQMADTVSALGSAPTDDDFIPAVEPARFGVTSARPAPTHSGPAFHANEVARAVMIARRYGLTPDVAYCAGWRLPRWTGDQAPCAVANNLGGFAFHCAPFSRITVRLTAPTGGSITCASEGTRRAHADGDGLISELISAFPPSRWPDRALTPLEARLRKPSAVILDRAAVVALLPPLLRAFSARSVVEDDDNPLSGAQGSAVFSDALTLRCDPTHAEHLGPPFDDLGVAAPPRLLIERGKVRDFVLDVATALRLGVVPSGHTLLTPTGAVALPRYPVLEGADPQPLAQLIQETPSALYITRLIPGPPSPRSPLVLSAYIAEGFFISGGEPAAWLPAAGLRLRFDLFQALAAVTATTAAHRVAGVVAPALRLAGGFSIMD
jgi:hypothetical protein